MTNSVAVFSPIRMTAATEEAAVQQALQIVGAARENVAVEVLSQNAKGTTVRVSPRKDDEASSHEASSDAVSNAALSSDASNSLRSSTRLPKENASEVYLSSQPEGAEIADAMNAVVPIQARALASKASASSDVELFAKSSNEDDGEQRAVENLQDVLPTISEEQPTIESIAQVSADAQQDAFVEAIIEMEADPEAQQRAQALAQQMLERMGMDAHAQIIQAPVGGRRSESLRNDTNQQNVPRIHLQIDGEDVGILIGKHGQTLQSFQYLLNVTLNNEVANGDGARFRVAVDAGGYRARRGDALQQMAHEAAASAKRDRRPVRLEPMPAQERRLVHMALQNDGTISTSSEGREPLRHVVVIPAGARPTSPNERNSRPNDSRPNDSRSSGDSRSGGGRPNGSFGGNRSARDGGYRGSR